MSAPVLRRTMPAHDTNVWRSVAHARQQSQCSPGKPGQTPHIAHPFTRMITCGHCGKHYTRKHNNGQPIWHCHTYMMFGKNACAAKAVPEAVLEAIVNETLGPNGLALLERIIVPEQYRLIFKLYDGHCIEKTWEPRSRSESWDEAARERAREHAKKRWSK